MMLYVSVRVTMEIFDKTLQMFTPTLRTGSKKGTTAINEVILKWGFFERVKLILNHTLT